MRVGLDIGSTTIKCVVLDEHDALLYSTYERHYSHILEKAQELLRRIDAEQLHGQKALLSISGSAGMGLADSCGVPFVQEVFSTRVAVKRFVPATDCVIELGGEDAKILFLTNGTEVRMNGSCAGGTGAFIDQMATLLKMGADEMNKAAENAQRTYTIASRCGVFAKSDVQPLINQGARTEDIAASIYKAVVNQTIAGLAQGRPIKGNILYLGGPLTFSSVLRKSFDEALNVTGICPENSLLYVALGAALYADKAFVLSEVADALDQYAATATYASEPPLFASKEEYEAFHARHMSHSVPRVPFSAQCGPVHIGIDSGSTTVKLVVVDEKSQILYTNYQPNLGNPLPLIREQLLKIYKEHPGLQVVSVTTTGYGEELVKNAFRCDYGLVETVAHFTAAKYFMPDVDFIIDIGGQDMKCFKIEDGAISNIFLNEACSSGCGSFLQTFAQALGYDVKKFASLGLFADRPVDLGSRCTVFMNSSVKQAQKDGASIENISAGLSISVVKNAFRCDFGLVETVAHFTAAKYFMPDVDFIIDIGGQDMKCFKIEDGAISNIFLNEACSSGCGSFLQTFAQALGYDVKEFAALGLFADRPVDLGSRCTVFMNSSVKQAQKDGASIENISAGLSISVVKNALYKVIRASSPEELGRKIVVQGGTFYNEAVLRAFEKEMGVEVIRPDIAGLMGAYGAALFGLRQSQKAHKTASAMMNEQELEAFAQKVVSVKCGGCGNHCQLTVNTFADGRKYISGNRCDKPVTGKSADDSLNLYAYKQQLLAEYKPVAGKRGSIGIPLCLGFYELLPFWWAFWTKLGFAVHTSPVSSRGLYLAGQATIPSDTACFPAKLSHGHIKALSQMQLDAIFYPCLTYNVDEGLGDNHYNCPVVAYYPEVLAGNCPELEGTKFIYDYVGIHRPKDFVHKMAKNILPKYFGGISEKEVQAAADAAYAEYESHMAKIRVKGSEIIDEARRQGKRIIVLAGRPYHVDPEVNHGIDRLITRHGAAVVTEDSISNRVQKFPTSVLNQWTYHSRLYAAAKYCTTQKDMDLVQLVSFGCGVDAITTDETREILQEGGKLYTQLKIDEITNLGAVNIRLRSLFAALDERDEVAAEKAE